MALRWSRKARRVVGDGGGTRVHCRWRARLRQRLHNPTFVHALRQVKRSQLVDVVDVELPTARCVGPHRTEIPPVPLTSDGTRSCSLAARKRARHCAGRRGSTNAALGESVSRSDRQRGEQCEDGDEGGGDSGRSLESSKRLVGTVILAVSMRCAVISVGHARSARNRDPGRQHAIDHGALATYGQGHVRGNRYRALCRGAFNLWSNPDVCQLATGPDGRSVHGHVRSLGAVRDSGPAPDEPIEFWEQAARDARQDSDGQPGCPVPRPSWCSRSATMPCRKSLRSRITCGPKFLRRKGFMLPAPITADRMRQGDSPRQCDRGVYRDDNVTSIRSWAARLGFVATERYKVRSQEYLQVSPTGSEPPKSLRISGRCSRASRAFQLQTVLPGRCAFAAEFSYHQIRPSLQAGQRKMSNTAHAPSSHSACRRGSTVQHSTWGNSPSLSARVSPGRTNPHAARTARILVHGMAPRSASTPGNSPAQCTAGFSRSRRGPLFRPIFPQGENPDVPQTQFFTSVSGSLRDLFDPALVLRIIAGSMRDYGDNFVRRI